MKKPGRKRASPASTLKERADAARAESSPDLAQMTAQEARRLVHELRVHQVELETQNEELRRAQEELALSRDRFNDLYDFAPVGYATIDLSASLLEANLTLARMLGVERGRLVGTKLSRFIAPETQDLLYLHLVAVQEGRAACSGEIVLKRADGSTFAAQLESACGKDPASGEITCRIALVDISERKKTEEQLKASLREKEVLLREIHHRVKNNLQVISSLVSLQAEGLTDGAVRSLFGDIRDRVRSMALVHERLYESESLAVLDFAEYVRSLLSYLFRTYGEAAEHVRMKLAVQKIALPVGAAVHCGLILNELVSNALKHAFPGGKGEIVVSLDRDAVSGAVCLSVRDDGIGLPEGFDWRHGRSLGLRLVQILAKQLRGSLERGPGHGTEFIVRFVAGGAMFAL